MPDYEKRHWKRNRPPPDRLRGGEEVVIRIKGKNVLGKILEILVSRPNSRHPVKAVVETENGNVKIKPHKIKRLPK